jgi:serine/threonine protein phosphatase PrpC
MGGHDAGEVASAMVIDALTRIGAEGDADFRRLQIQTVLDGVNRNLIDMGRATAQTEQRTIGSTVVGLTADDHRYACFWAGDSRAYRARAGEIRQLTRDHSLVQDLVDAGMMDASEAENHPQANVITRAIGAADFLQLDAVGGQLQSGDTFLLASDGLTRLARDEELLGLLQSDDLEIAADRLLDLALARGAPDNVSLVIVRVLSVNV